MTLLLLLFTKGLLLGSDMVTFHIAILLYIDGNITLLDRSLGSGNDTLTLSFLIQIRFRYGYNKTNDQNYIGSLAEIFTRQEP